MKLFKKGAIREAVERGKCPFKNEGSRRELKESSSLDSLNTR